MFIRRLVLASVSALLWGSMAVAQQSVPQLHVYKSATCACCSEWIKHMTANGFAASTEDLASGALARVKQGAGIGPKHASCHTAKIGNYIIEGHVPAGDVKRLLAEKPDAVGLAVPGMPIGSPGMEAGDTRQPYDVLLIKRDGTSEVWSKQNQ